MGDEKEKHTHIEREPDRKREGEEREKGETGKEEGREGKRGRERYGGGESRVKFNLVKK